MGQGRCARALQSATAVPDRLALLREWARLSDGHLDLTHLALNLSENEIGRAADFGLEVSGSLLRLTDHVSGLPLEVAKAFRLDSSDRRLFASGTPDAALRRWSQHSRYRSETQKAAVRAMLRMPTGSALMASMPTGTGKSLLFQIAPLAWRAENESSCAVVITPTIALALDHERTLRQIPGLEKSRALTSQLNSSEHEEVLFAFRRGEIPLLILSPEQAFGSAREALLEAASAPDKKVGLKARLGAFFIDEAHIVESWGRSFRPDFQRLPGLVDELRGHNPHLRTVLLSATLGRAATGELRRAYGRGEWLEIHAGVPRYEFNLAAERYDDRESRDASLYGVINCAPRPAIIYTSLVAHARDVFEELQRRGHERVALFTGEISDGATRQSIIEEWANDKLDLVVATSAFGMGIDKSDVRTIIHACLPEGPARYYQEIGRAARDGRQGIGVCLWARGFGDDDDEALARRLASGSWITREKAQKRWQAIRTWGETNGGLKWADSRKRMTVNLDAVREGLPGESSDYNRLWNMSVLNLLQRAGVIEITGVSAPDKEIVSWQVDILHDSVLRDGPAQDALWDEIEEFRTAEQSAAIESFNRFRSLLLGKMRCVLTGVFDLIDLGGSMPAECGRCWVCEAKKVRVPSTVHSGGLDQVWPHAHDSNSPLPTGVTMVLPDDLDVPQAQRELIGGLVAVGIEQYVVPDEMAGGIADHLADSDCAFGFLLTHADWLECSWHLDDVPTAVILNSPSGADRIWRALKGEVKNRPQQRFVLVAPSQSRAENRPLAQVASKQAPFSQEAFHSICAWRNSKRS